LAENLNPQCLIAPVNPERPGTRGDELLTPPTKLIIVTLTYNIFSLFLRCMELQLHAAAGGGGEDDEKRAILRFDVSRASIVLRKKKMGKEDGAEISRTEECRNCVWRTITSAAKEEEKTKRTILVYAFA
jgi:hypothetical protein